jgi:hypothetical protein
VKADIEVQGPGKARILLDGVDVAKGTRSLDISAGVGDIATLTLNMALTQGARFRGDVVVRLSIENEALLQHLGWTPPAPDPALPASVTGSSAVLSPPPPG